MYDHRPVIARLALRKQIYFDSLKMSRANGTQTYVECAWHWDKANLNNYYESTRLMLAAITPSSVCLTCITPPPRLSIAGLTIAQ
jgi:hypothetical protein